MTFAKPRKKLSEPRKRRADPEAQLQRTVIAHLKARGIKGLIYHSIPNEARRTPATAARLKAQGMLPGVADLILVAPGGKAHYLELKAPKGKLSDDQEAFFAACCQSDISYNVAWEIDTALYILDNWGLLGTVRKA